MLFEAFALRVLQETSIQAARKILALSWDEAWYLMHRAVARGLARKKPRPISYLGVDEKSAGRGQTNYVTVVCDLVGGTVEEVTEGREKRSLLDYLDGLTPEQREAISAVGMDMCDAYIYAVKDGLPDGQNKIVFDRFHVMQHMRETLRAVPEQPERLVHGRDHREGDLQGGALPGAGGGEHRPGVRLHARLRQGVQYVLRLQPSLLVRHPRERGPFLHSPSGRANFPTTRKARITVMDQHKLYRTIRLLTEQEFRSDEQFLGSLLEHIILMEEIPIRGGRIWKFEPSTGSYRLVRQYGEIDRIEKNLRLKVEEYPPFQQLAKRGGTVAATETNKQLRQDGHPALLGDGGG